MNAPLHIINALEVKSEADLLHTLDSTVSEAAWTEALLKAGGLRGLVHKDDLALAELLPLRALESVRAAFELTKRYHLAGDLRPHLDTPYAIESYLRPLIGHLPVERFVVLSLNTRNALLGMDVVSDGSVDQCTVDPRTVFRAALARNASGIVLAHNHPSGDPEPSFQDRELTRQFVRAAQLLCIKLLDHLVLGSTSYTSMLTRGLLRS